MWDASGSWTPRGSTVTLRYHSDELDCAGAVGVYTVEVTGNMLRLNARADACQGRRQRLGQPFERVTRAHCERRSDLGIDMYPDCCNYAVDGEGCD
jgi:hypothetical protein